MGHDDDRAPIVGPTAVEVGAYYAELRQHMPDTIAGDLTRMWLQSQLDAAWAKLEHEKKWRPRPQALWSET
jgi:hypothetical protein